MITLLTSLVAACGVGAALFLRADWAIGWSITLGVVSFGVLQVGFGLILRKKVAGEMSRVQEILAAGQKRLQVKMSRWQMRPPGSMQAAQNEIANDTKIFVKEALAQTENMRKYRLWIPMLDRQIATAQFQLNWMIKNFSVCDKLLPKVLMVDPTMAAMKMARMYMLKSSIEEIAKVYKKASRRLRYNQNVLIAACYSWILVKSNNADEAFKVLTAALKNSDDAVLKRNHELLMNNRVLQFTNSGLGDQWFSLYLDEPKVKSQRQHIKRM